MLWCTIIVIGFRQFLIFLWHWYTVTLGAHHVWNIFRSWTSKKCKTQTSPSMVSSSTLDPLQSMWKPRSIKTSNFHEIVFLLSQAVITRLSATILHHWWETLEEPWVFLSDSPSFLFGMALRTLSFLLSADLEVLYCSVFHWSPLAVSFRFGMFWNICVHLRSIIA